MKQKPGMRQEEGRGGMVMGAAEKPNRSKMERERKKTLALEKE